MAQADLAAQVATLRDLRDQATGGERALFDRMVSLFERLHRITKQPSDAAKTELGPWLRDFVALLRDVAKASPDDPEVQVQVATTFHSLPLMSETLGLDPSAYADVKREGIAMADSAAKRFPKDARVHAAKASFCKSDGGEALECMRELVKCTELEPRLPDCASRLEQGRTEYTRPYCEGASIDPGLALHAARAAKPGQVAVAERDAKFTAKDVAAVREIEQRISTQEWDATKQTMGPMAETMEVAVAIELLPDKLDHLATWTEELARDGASVVVRVGNDELTNARVVSSIRGPMTVGLPIAQLCRKTSRRELPADLARALSKHSQ